MNREDLIALEQVMGSGLRNIIDNVTVVHPPTVIAAMKERRRIREKLDGIKRPADIVVSHQIEDLTDGQRVTELRKLKRESEQAERDSQIVVTKPPKA